ncbi:MAG: hypothetical protein LZF60_270160 [Nitrospira sp.]|nr:hypothetical protein [Nitrospira sp.]ULA60834.1 MAG: hypothetical protein LZF60_270160 [Nitrospira sp.]
MTRRAPILAVFTLLSAISACKTGSDPGVPGIYQTWDDVISRWIGKHKEDLYLELGPPNLHPKETEDGTVEMVWDMTIDRMPGQADAYHTLPLYGGVDCRLKFFADKEGLVISGRRDGCE